MKILILAAALVAAVPAQAALFVSGDSNIITPLGSSIFFASPDAGNQRFFSNLLNGSANVVLRNGAAPSATSIKNSFVSDYYSSIGVTTTVLASSDAVTSANLAGAGLFIDVFPGHRYSSSEALALANYINAGNNVVLTGEWGNYTATIGWINQLLGRLGGDISIVPDNFAPGAHQATIVGPSAYLAGVSTFGFALSSAVSGGTTLFAYKGTPFVASVDTVATPTVPEPASWAMLIAGFGLTGAALRRRRQVVAVAA